MHKDEKMRYTNISLLLKIEMINRVIITERILRMNYL
jgi:hypothetical protein